MDEEILEGLRSATARGEPLLQAMMTFYNAGYGKSEIEEAAQILQQQNAGIPIATPQTQVVQPVVQQPTQSTPPIQPNQPALTPQIVSAYTPKKKGKNTLTIVLISFLVFLFGALITVFIFREQITAAFNNIF